MTSLLQRTEYPDEFRTQVFGPFLEADFAGAFSLPLWVPDKAIWIDQAWVRAATDPSTAAVFQLHWAEPAESMADAITAVQDITVASDLNTLVDDTVRELVIVTAASGGAPINRVPAFGLLFCDFELLPTSLVGFFIGVRFRDREP